MRWSQEAPATSTIIHHVERDSNRRSTYKLVIDLFDHKDASPNDLKAAWSAKKALDEKVALEVNPLERWIADPKKNNL